MANNNTSPDIQLIAGLDINASEQEILAAIKILQGRIKGNSNTDIKLKADVDVKTVTVALNKIQGLINSKKFSVPLQQSLVETQRQLEELAKNINSVQSKVNDISIKTNLNTTNVEKQVKAVNQQIHNNMQGIDVPFQIDMSDAKAIKQEVNRIVAEITKNQGELIKYKIGVEANGDANKVLLTYRNELNEVTNATLKLKEVGKWYDAQGNEQKIVQWADGYKTLSQNIEQTVKAQQKEIETANQIIRKRDELVSKMQLINTQSEKGGISISKENLEEFNKLASSVQTMDDVRELENYVKLARLELQKLNSEISTGQHSTALESMSVQLQKMPQELDIIEAKFQSLGKGADYSATIENMRQNLASLDDVNDPSQKIQQYNELVQTLEFLRKEFQITSLEEKNLNTSINTTLNAGTLTNKIVTWMSENQKGAVAFDAELRKIIADLQSVDSKADLTRLNNEFRNIKQAVEATDAVSKGFFGQLKDDLGEAVNNIFRYQLAYKIINEATQAFDEMTDSVDLLDASLVELQKVTDGLTDNQLEKITQKAYEIGDAVAKTGTNTLNAITEFKRSGFSLDESFDFAEDALKMVNVSENIRDAGDSAKYLISVMKGYGDTSTDFSKHILDAVNEVSNTSAVDYDNLIEGSQTLSAVASQANVEFEQMLGLLTGGYEVLGNMSKVSNGLITILARISSIQLEGEEDVETSAKMEEIFSNATKGAVHVLDQQTGQLRNTYDIMRDLANVWDTLDTNTQSAIAEASAGKRQRNTFLSVIQNWNSVEKAVDSARNSVGSAEQENQVYLESISGLKEEMASAKELFAKEMIDDQWIKDVIEAGTNLIKTFTNLAGQDSIVSETIGAITSSLKVLTETLETLSENDGIALLVESFITLKGITTGMDIFKSFKEGNQFQTFLQGVMSATSSTEVLNKVVAESAELNTLEGKAILESVVAKNTASIANGAETLSTEALIKALIEESVQEGILTAEKGAGILESYGAVAANEAQALSIGAVTKATLGMIATNPMTWIMGGIVVANLAINKFKDLENEMNETADASEAFANSVNKSFSAVSDNAKSLSELEDRYNELSKGVNTLGENLTLSAEEYDEYKSIIGQVSDIMPNLTTHFNAQGEAIGFTAGKLDSLTESYQKYIQAQAKKYLTNGDDEGNTFGDALQNYANNKEMSKGTAFAKTFKAQIGLTDADSVAVEDLLQGLRDVQNKSQEEVAKYLQDITTTMDINGMERIVNDNNTILKSAIAKVIGSAGEVLDMSGEEYNQLQEQIAQYIETYVSKRRLSKAVSAHYFGWNHLPQSAVHEAKAHYFGCYRRLSRAYFSSASAGLK